MAEARKSLRTALHHFRPNAKSIVANRFPRVLQRNDRAIQVTAAVLRKPGPIESDRLVLEARALPALRSGEIRVAIRACGVCRTDLHIVEGELAPRHPAIVPGHQIVGTVSAAAPDVTLEVGTRVGISWLGGVDGNLLPLSNPEWVTWVWATELGGLTSDAG